MFFVANTAASSLYTSSVGVWLPYCPLPHGLVVYSLWFFLRLQVGFVSLHTKFPGCTGLCDIMGCRRLDSAQATRGLGISSLLSQLQIGYFNSNLKTTFCSLWGELMHHPHPSLPTGRSQNTYMWPTYSGYSNQPLRNQFMKFGSIFIHACIKFGVCVFCRWCVWSTTSKASYC